MFNFKKKWTNRDRVLQKQAFFVRACVRASVRACETNTNQCGIKTKRVYHLDVVNVVFNRFLNFLVSTFLSLNFTLRSALCGFVGSVTRTVYPRRLPCLSAAAARLSYALPRHRRGRAKRGPSPTLPRGDSLGVDRGDTGFDL